MSSALQPVLLLLAIAVLVVVACRLLKQPPILGYLLVGVLIGPHLLQWMPESEGTEILGEVGVLFLMFSIGLEFSLSRLKSMRSSVLGLGGAQVLLSLAVTPLLAMLLQLDWKAGLALGGILAMSSTAIVSKLLSERRELDSPHGRQVFGVLLFQDLSVVPLLILIPALTLAPSGPALLKQLGIAALQAVVVLAAIFYFGDKLLRRWFHLVARQHSSELFILNVLLVTLGIAWLTSLAQLSLALGAFLAGMLISETEYRFEVEDSIRPFRDVLLGLFFVTIGMRLDLRQLWQVWPWVLLFFALLQPGKLLIISGLSRLFRHPSGVALRTGLHLAQAGEFGFVLLALATPEGNSLLPPAIQQGLLAAMVLSMFTAPLLIQRSDKLVLRLVRSEWMSQSLQLTRIAMQSMEHDGHVILCGYGRSGQYLSRILSQEDVPFMALDLDPERVAEATAAGETVVFGDAGKREALLAAGLKRARAVVVTFDDPHQARKIISHVHGLQPGLPVIVRTQGQGEVEQLREAGAAEVVAEVLEGSLMLASHTLMLLGTPLSRVLRRIRDTREQQYALFRGIFVGESDVHDGHDWRESQLHSVTLSEQAFAVGKTLAELDLQPFEVSIRTVRRRTGGQLAPEPALALAADDTVVLLGRADNLAASERYLLQGP